jgi:SH3 domain protein
VVEIVEARDRLQKTNDQLSAEVSALTAENSDLMRTGALKWFLAGGGVFLLGWLIGKMSRKKQSRF